MIVEKGYAKINLVLEVVGRRSDGYHDLEMVSTTIDLYDELYFMPINENNIIIESDDLDNVPKESNLIYKAAILLKERFNIKTGVKVRVIKRIPIGAGLAGGSADAAATLRGLNRLWNLRLSLDDLATLGLELGSDVPFCVHNKTAIVKGRGEILEFIEDVPFGYVVMVHPNFSSSTKTIFSHYKKTLQSKDYVKKMHQAITLSDLSLVSKCLYNDLECTVDHVYRQNNLQPINFIKNELIRYGVLNAVMSGSGSTVYGLCLTTKQANQVKAKFEANNKHLFTSLKFSSNSYNIAVYSLRSSRKSIKTDVSLVELQNTQAKEKVRENEKIGPQIIKEYNVIEIIHTKAYGRALLSFSSYPKHYQIIEAPLNAYDEIRIEIIDQPIYKVIVNNQESTGQIYDELLEVINKFNLPDGYIIRITKHLNNSLKLVRSQTYIARVIRKLSKYYGLDVDVMFENLNPRLKCYQYEKVYEYNNKTKAVRFLENIPYSYIVVIPLGLRKLNNGCSWKYATNNFAEYQNVLRGLEQADYFLITANLSNNLENYYFRQYRKIPRANKVSTILEHIRKVKINNYILSFDGTSIIVFFKNERKANELIQRLKRDFIYGAQIFSFKSSVGHKSSFASSHSSKVNLGQIETSEIEKIIDKQLVEIPTDEDDLLEIVTPEDIDFNNIEINDEELAGLFHIASPGSIFKQYDYVDLVKFFLRYFHNTIFNLEIDGKKVKILFNITCLPHIFGLHLIEENNLEYRGYYGVKKVLNGEITYDNLKKLRSRNKISDDTFKMIVRKTQSAFLVLKDLYMNNLGNIICFDRDFIKKPTSKLINLKYAITRRLADNYQRDLNLIGIGYDQKNDYYFFYTSFLWRVNKTITKGDYRDIIVKKEQ